MGSLCLLLIGQPRESWLLALGGVFCFVWPLWMDLLWRRPPAGIESSRYEMLLYAGECTLTAAVFGWLSLPPLALLAATVCLLAGAMALAGWRLAIPAGIGLAAGMAAGAAAAPELTAASTGAVDAVAMLLILGYALALASQSFRQAQRLDAHRLALAERSAVLERLNQRMQRYLPPSLRARLARAPEEPCRWERAWLTVAFVDLVGFTELSERLDAEALADILDEYLSALVPAAERRGGEVSKLLGDGVMAVFGGQDGNHRRDRVVGAVDFCREVPGLLEGLADHWRARGDVVRLRMRAGVASGFCTLGDRGGAGRFDFTLIGGPVNLASRLQAHAPEDGVLLDPASAALAECVFTLAPPRMLDIKGLGNMATYALVDPSAPSAIVPAPLDHR